MFQLRMELPPLGEMSLKEGEKQAVMVRVLEVKEFVDGDVILQRRIKTKHVEGKAQSPTARAGSPLPPHVHHHDLTWMCSHPMRPIGDAGFEFCDLVLSNTRHAKRAAMILSARSIIAFPLTTFSSTL